MKPTRIGFLMLGALLGTEAGPARADTWVILADGSGDAPTIQAGIDSAASGDTVSVMPGTYLENIDFLGKAIVVRGAGADVTTIDGSQVASSVVTFKNQEPREAILEDFTVTGGSGYSPFGIPGGGGILILNAEPTIRGNVVELNQSVLYVDGRARGVGGGIYCFGEERVFRPRIEENTIRFNRTGLLGGGIYVSNLTSPAVVGNNIAWNEAVSGDGGGISLTFGRAPIEIMGNTIVGNRAGDHGGGIELSSHASSEISWNLIAENISEAAGFGGNSGGGISITTTSLARVHHNTLVANNDDSSLRNWGGGIAVSGGQVLLEWNIIALSPKGGGIYCRTGASEVTARNNVFWANIPDHDLTCGIPFGPESGNLVVDPLFCNPGADDYTLAENSPALLHPAGPAGAFPVPGCTMVTVTPTTWGRLKSRFGTNGP